MEERSPVYTAIWLPCVCVSLCMLALFPCRRAWERGYVQVRICKVVCVCVCVCVCVVCLSPVEKASKWKLKSCQLLLLLLVSKIVSWFIWYLQRELAVLILLGWAWASPTLVCSIPIFHDILLLLIITEMPDFTVNETNWQLRKWCQVWMWQSKTWGTTNCSVIAACLFFISIPSKPRCVNLMIYQYCASLVSRFFFVP